MMWGGGVIHALRLLLDAVDDRRYCKFSVSAANTGETVFYKKNPVGI